MLCRVEMPTNEQIYGRFYRYRILHQPGGGRLGIILMPLLIVALLFFVISWGVSPLLLGLVIVLVAAWGGYTFWVRPNSVFRSKGGAALQTEVMIFTEGGYNRSVKSEEGGVPDNASGSYAGLHSAVETGRDFYLFTSPTQAYLVDKEYFTKGSPEELRTMLDAKMGGKFKYPGKKMPKKR